MCGMASVMPARGGADATRAAKRASSYFPEESIGIARWRGNAQKPP